MAGVKIIADPLVSDGIMVLLRDGKPVFVGPVGSEIFDIEAEEARLSPDNYDALVQAALDGEC